MKAFLPFLLILCFVAAANAVEFSLQATVTVNPPPIELEVETEVLTEMVDAGEDLLFLVELSKQALNEITVDLKYEIIKKKWVDEEILLSETDSMQLTDYNSMQKTISIPVDFKPGKYALRVTASYFNQSDSDEGKFFARKAMPAKPKGLFTAIFFLFNLFF